MSQLRCSGYTCVTDERYILEAHWGPDAARAIDKEKFTKPVVQP